MQENEILVPKEILNFLTGVYCEKDKADTALKKEKIFNRAFEMAYKDMSTHTVAYKKDSGIYERFIEGQTQRTTDNKKRIRGAVKNYIKDSFINQGTDGYDLTGLQKINSQDSFDKWHRELCDKIADFDDNCTVELRGKDGNEEIKISDILCHTDKKIQSHVFTYGQAQKLVNMMLKYLYIYYKCEGWDTLNELVPYFHVPIDSHVLKEALQDKERDKMSWSKINSYEEYESYQEAIRSFEKVSQYPSPFMWELTEWPFK